MNTMTVTKSIVEILGKDYFIAAPTTMGARARKVQHGALARRLCAGNLAVQPRIPLNRALETVMLDHLVPRCPAGCP